MSVTKYVGLIGVLSSTIIGAGIFSLPYLFGKVGVVHGVLFLFFFAFVYVAVHAMYAQLVIKNPGMEFGSLVKKHCGRYGEFAQWFVVGELLSVCLVYLVLAPDFFSILFGAYHQMYGVLFWIFGVVGMLFSMKWIEISETIGLLGILVLVGIVGWYGATSEASLPWHKDITHASQILILFGPLLFSFSGRPSVRRIVGALKQDQQKFIYPIITLGTLIPAFIYLVYTFGILCVQGGESVLGAFSQFPGILPLVFSMLGIVALWTSYFIVGINARDILLHDMHIRKITAFLIVSFVPLILSLLGVKSFIGVISFVGSIFLALEGMFIVYMWQREATRNVYWYGSFFVFLVFFIAFVQEIILFIQ